MGTDSMQEVMAENFPVLMKITNLRSYSSQGIPSRINKFTLQCNIMKLENIETEELKSS